MPLYEYECKVCGRRTEVIQRFDDAPLAACPECGGAVERLLSAPAVQFKGSGWYVTDYAGKGSSARGDGAGEAKSGDGDKAAGAGEGKGKQASEKPAKNAASE